MLIFISGTGLQTVTFHTPRDKNATLVHQHKAPDRDFFIPRPIKIQHWHENGALDRDFYKHTHLIQNAIFDHEDGSPDRDFCHTHLHQIQLLSNILLQILMFIVKMIIQENILLADM